MDGEDELVGGYGVVLVHPGHHLEPAKLSAKSSAPNKQVRYRVLVFIAVTYQEDREYTSDPDPYDPYGTVWASRIRICNYLYGTDLDPSINKQKN